jgi:hypothetical protein
LPENFHFQDSSKFTLVALHVHTTIGTEFQLADGTWVLPGVPVPDMGVWTHWIGSIRAEQLRRANLILLAQKLSDNPMVVDDVHQSLSEGLSYLFYLLHLKSGIDSAGGADSLWGYNDGEGPVIRHMSRMPTFYQSRGCQRRPLTQSWIENSIDLRTGLRSIQAQKETDNILFKRFFRGLNTLFKALKERDGQDRHHQFVRSIEGLILPDTGQTKKQFVRRCQTFAGNSNATLNILREAFEMRSDTEHLQDWERAVQHHPADQRENICLQRMRQLEKLACDAYKRLLSDHNLSQHFRTDAQIAAFWNLQDSQREALWGAPLDITQERLVQNYDSAGRAMPTP